MTMTDLRVLHVTEAMAGGILSVLTELANQQAGAGASVTVAYTVRPNGPSAAAIAAGLDLAVVSRSLPGSGRAGRVAAISKFLLEAIRSDEYDVVHLHSTFAGAVGRLTSRLRRGGPVVLYSPHGYSFLRESSSAPVRALYARAERVLARAGDGLILSCESERVIAEQVLGVRDAAVVTMGISESELRSSPASTDRMRPRVGMVGRICYQKAPWVFGRLASEFRETADFVWIGDGPEDLKSQWLNGSPARIAGWLDGDDFLSAIDDLDILLFPTLWEGMSLSLMLAQARGLPAVTSDVVGNRDAIVDGSTGFVCASEEEMITSLNMLISDVEARRRMAENAIDHARNHLTTRNLEAEMSAAYRGFRVAAEADSRT